MAQMMTTGALTMQNRTFEGTRGTSQGNRHMGFVPGFLDQETGSVYRSCGCDGTPCVIHTLDGLPEHLVVERNARGKVSSVKGTVVAGFLRDGRFYTREQAAEVGSLIDRPLSS